MLTRSTRVDCCCCAQAGILNYAAHCLFAAWAGWAKTIGGVVAFASCLATVSMGFRERLKFKEAAIASRRAASQIQVCFQASESSSSCPRATSRFRVSLSANSCIKLVFPTGAGTLIARVRECVVCKLWEGADGLPNCGWGCCGGVPAESCFAYHTCTVSHTISTACTCLAPPMTMTAAHPGPLCCPRWRRRP